MENIPFSKVFSGEYLKVITNYSRTIQTILDSYDVVIFMARKAICFYQSMITNGIITPTKCEIISSRVIDYNVIKKLKDLKIAIVDDVVVKGRSLEKVLTKLNKYNISSDVYVAACEEKVASKLFNNKIHNISQKLVYFDSTEIYMFSGLITEYIELSMCPFNVDQPIYECNFEIDKVVSKLNEMSTLNITSGTQRKYGITSKVLYLKYISFDNDSINSIIQKSILKIRFLYNDKKVIAIPFVLFPEITKDELKLLYDYLSIETNIFQSSTDKITEENKLKIINSFFADLIFKDFFGNCFFERCFYIDYYQFYLNSNELYGTRLQKLLTNSNRSISIVTVNCDCFCFPKYVGEAIKFISKIRSADQKFTNATGNKIDDVIITYEYLYNSFYTSGIDNSYIVSSIVDVLIDRGMIVPSIIHHNENIIRAYKLGEYSKLTRAQLESFVAMLFKYQTLIDSNLGKIEFEKLCVLFFTQGIHFRIFEQQTEYEDDCYGVCYSLYGPRISDNDQIYKVDSDSALITDFLYNELVRKQNNTYIIESVSVQNTELDHFANTFALQYSKIRKLFDQVKNEEIESRKNGNRITLWNQYVHTYSQYLTLRSIGNGKKNQFLSLCAELYQVLALNDSFFEFRPIEQKRINKIISGINSGLWKYFCYKNDALNKTNIDIYKKDENVAAIIGCISCPVHEDRNPALEKILDKAGSLLFEIAFFIQNAVDIMNKTSYFTEFTNIDSELADEVSSTQKNIFSQFYYKIFEEKRHIIESNIKKQSISPDFVQFLRNELYRYKKACRFLLDYCELYLASETSQYEFFNKMIILYSRDAELPSVIENVNEIFLDTISTNTMCKVFMLPDRETGYTILTNILDSTYNISSISYIVLDMETQDDGAIQICEHAKGTFLSKIIKSELDHLENAPISPSPKMVFIKKEAINDFQRNNYRFIKVKQENISCNYIRTTLDIIPSCQSPLINDVSKQSNNKVTSTSYQISG